MSNRYFSHIYYKNLYLELFYKYQANLGKYELHRTTPKDPFLSGE